MELWGGIECTINRVGDNYMDQLEYSGHYSRIEDLDEFAGLGIKKLRYPVLWEKHKPRKNMQIDWSQTGKFLSKLKDLKIDVIAGLVHHGSGPAYVHMMDDSFAEGLRDYAAEVATKFPWISYYTPVNEPLTTARFCGLYGHWFPHQADGRSFLKILLNECKATVLAMQAIRKINPEAKLVQTEDLGKIHSTSLLKYQADFENDRRWLSVDLLCGRVDQTHTLWNYILSTGISEEELMFFVENPCPPDIVGFNHYITSERFLDERLEHYPPHTHGGNGKHQYADVEAIRMSGVTLSGPYGLMKEAWERYKLPLAITEVHLHCTREEQLRWFSHVWQAALELEREGVNLKAVTSWAMLGSFGWNKLLREPNGDYEAGIYDARSGRPRPTALCDLIKSVTDRQDYDHPAFPGLGWWDKDTRIEYHHDPVVSKVSAEVGNRRPILIIGKTGTLGNAFARICDIRNLEYCLLGRADFDITRPQQMEAVLSDLKPWAIVNAAGFVRVDDAENEESNCYMVNTTGPANIARLCCDHRIKFLSFSSDLVFDGTKSDLYTETDAVNPLNIYGWSKAKAEQEVLAACPDALMVRTSAFFGPWDEYNFISAVRRRLEAGEPVTAVNDILISPTYVPDLVNVSLDLLIDGERGLWHLSNEGVLSWYEFARQAAAFSGHNPSQIIPIPASEMDFTARRPSFSALKSRMGYLLPTVEHALDRHFKELRRAV